MANKKKSGAQPRRAKSADRANATSTVVATKTDVASFTLITIMLGVVALMLGLFSAHAAAGVVQAASTTAFAYESYDFYGIGEYGTIRNLTHGWKKVKFLNRYTLPPIVVASPLSRNGGEPAHARIRNVTVSGFEVKVEEWAYSDGPHVRENMSFLAVERGKHNPVPGLKMVVGYQEVRAKQRWVSNGFNYFETSEYPTILASLQTYKDPDPATIGISVHPKDKTVFGVKIVSEEAKANDPHANEKFGFIAISRYEGEDSKGFYMKSDRFNLVSQWKTLGFSRSYEEPPVVLAQMNTINGTDASQLRYRNWDRDSIDYIIEEEQSLDSEVNHTTETVGYFVLPVPQRGEVAISKHAVVGDLVPGASDVGILALMLDPATGTQGQIKEISINVSGTAKQYLSDFSVVVGGSKINLASDPQPDGNGNVRFVFAEPLDLQTFNDPSAYSGLTLNVTADVASDATAGNIRVALNQNMVLQPDSIRITYASDLYQDLEIAEGGKLTVIGGATTQPRLVPGNSGYHNIGSVSFVAENEDIAIEEMYLTAEPLNGGGWEQIQRLIFTNSTKSINVSVVPTSTNGQSRTALLRFNPPLAVNSGEVVKLDIELQTLDYGAFESGKGLQVLLNSATDVKAKGMQTTQRITDIILNNKLIIGPVYTVYSLPDITTYENLFSFEKLEREAYLGTNIPLYRFRGAAFPNTVGVGKFSFLIQHSDSLQVTQFRLNESNPATSSDVVGVLPGGAVNGRVDIYPLESVYTLRNISSGSDLYTLSADIACAPGVACQLEGDKYVSTSMLFDNGMANPFPATFGQIANGNNFVWTDYSYYFGNNAQSLNLPQWFNSSNLANFNWPPTSTPAIIMIR